ncbi:hypothetical protein TWF569_010808 [Orbilia oligospora]|uniref:Uncharacterized protein n=1 Tax=Orbilia oligospora TaxID=2813651 RepID=A0A7C8J120_ORBOL|nr:hypothetical protein TWF102_001631 [Orbilia oligospora]KAF3091356.1 hypothetical protein TWF706_009590 [Orbilia oligospora]KAF3106544.1 hypothetical protein TWF103_006049 [Orbilia oligospora]KAF3132637.1 hypothetical protein TWF594_009457 [Orbilia oligospora]KAF3132827.1 hypothetical protein TWF569_010808 [Orbilia oligospora]
MSVHVYRPLRALQRVVPTYPANRLIGGAIRSRPQTSTRPFDHDITFTARTFCVSPHCQSGHNKWSKIRHEKGKKDANKANSFSKLSEQITEYTKRYGSDPKTNGRLKLLLDQAKKSGMSGTSMDNAVKRGQGLSISGKPLETVNIEGMTQEGVSFIVECVTDNKLRTLQDVRLIINKAGGKLTPVSYLFVKHPYMHLTGPEDLSPENQTAALEDPILTLPIEYVGLLPGETSTWEARVEYSEPPMQLVEDMQKILPEGWSVTKTGLKYYPSDHVQVEDESEAGDAFRNFVEKLEDCSDVSEIYSNLRWSSYEPPKHEIVLTE